MKKYADFVAGFTGKSAVRTGALTNAHLLGAVVRKRYYNEELNEQEIRILRNVDATCCWEYLNGLMSDYPLRGRVRGTLPTYVGDFFKSAAKGEYKPLLSFAIGQNTWYAYWGFAWAFRTLINRNIVPASEVEHAIEYMVHQCLAKLTLSGDSEYLWLIPAIIETAACSVPVYAERYMSEQPLNIPHDTARQILLGGSVECSKGVQEIVATEFANSSWWQRYVSPHLLAEKVFVAYVNV